MLPLHAQHSGRPRFRHDFYTTHAHTHAHTQRQRQSIYPLLHFPIQARGCPLRSLSAVPTPSAQVERLVGTGWRDAAAADMAAIYHDGTAPGRRSGIQSGSGCKPDDDTHGWLHGQWRAERRRIERLELLDELEEWILLQVRVWGGRGCTCISDNTK